MNIEGRTILVTGGAGFIGSELVSQICAAGGKVVVVDNLVNGRKENLAGLPADQIELEIADIRDLSRLRDSLRRCDVVFHLACLGVRHSLHSPIENHEVNASATLGLLSAARDLGVQRFVFVSSSEVYGSARWTPMAEDHPTFPTTVYGASKLAGECYVRAFHRSFGCGTLVVRPFNTYGPRSHHEGDCGEVIPKFLLRSMAGRPMVIFGDGCQTRDFTYVSDTAQGILRAGFCDEAVGETVNLGRGKEVTMNDLAVKVARALGLKAPSIFYDDPRPGDIARLCADTTHARALFGYAPLVGMTEGLRRLHDWYLRSGATAEELLSQEQVRNWHSADKVNDV
jgi:UDP-glucose 4-epimerase